MKGDITRNRDEKGYLLTYTVDMGDYELECNTAKEAKLFAEKKRIDE